MLTALLPRHTFDRDKCQVYQTKRQFRAAHTSGARTPASDLVTMTHQPRGARVFISLRPPNPFQLSTRSPFNPTCAMPITNALDRYNPPPPTFPKMITESMSPLANEMSALHDQLEQLEEENAILRASDVGQLTARHARDSATIKELASEIHTLRAASRAHQKQDPTPTSKGSNSRKRKLDDSLDVAGPSLGRADDDSSIETEKTEKTERPQDGGKDSRKKPKLGPLSTANDFVTGDAQGRSAEYLALSAKRAEHALKAEVQYLRRQNSTFFRRTQRIEQDWFADKEDIRKLQATVNAQKEALAAQAEASAARKADFKRRTKDVDALLEEISHVRSSEPKYAERTKQFLCRAIKMMVNIASLDSGPKGQPNIKSFTKEQGGEGANRALERGPSNDKGKGKALAIASDIGSIYKDESVRGDLAGPPGPLNHQQERRHVSVPAGLANDPREPCERKPLGELPAEMFQLEDEVAREAAQEAEAAQSMECLRPPPASWPSAMRSATWPRAMPPATWSAAPMRPAMWSAPMPPATWPDAGAMRPTTCSGAMPPSTWPGAMRPY